MKYIYTKVTVGSDRPVLYLIGDLNPGLVHVTPLDHQGNCS